MEDGDGEVRDVGGLLEEEEEEIVVDSDEGSEGSDQTAYDYCPSDHSSEKTASYTGSDDDSYESSSSTSSSSSQIFDDDLFPTPLDCVSDIYPRWQRIVTLQQRYVRQYADHHRLLGVANQKLEWVDENRGVWAPGVYVERLELWRGFRRADLKSLRIAMVNVARMTREKKKLHVQGESSFCLLGFFSFLFDVDGDKGRGFGTDVWSL